MVFELLGDTSGIILTTNAETDTSRQTNHDWIDPDLHG